MYHSISGPAESEISNGLDFLMTEPAWVAIISMFI